MGNAFGKKRAPLPAKASGAMAAKEGPAANARISLNSTAKSTSSSDDVQPYSSGSSSEAPAKAPPAAKKTAWDAPKSKKESGFNAASSNYFGSYANVVTGKIDGGCSTTMMSQRTYNSLINAGAEENMAPCTSVASVYKFANGETKRANAQVSIGAQVNGCTADINANVFEDSNTHFLLGLNFLRQHRVSIRYSPDGDIINCEKLGLREKVLPRDTAGLDVLPFFAQFPGAVEDAHYAGQQTGRQAIQNRIKANAKDRKKWQDNRVVE